MSRRLLAALAALSLCGLTLLTGGSAQAATVRACDLDLASGAVIHVTASFVESGGWESWSVHWRTVRAVYDDPTVTVDRAYGADGTAARGPGGHPPLDWTGGWLAAPVTISTAATTAEGGGGAGCMLRP